ncbi:MAG: antibiotic biosynthesis monooxygenase [Sphingobacteriales bacterium]|nr:antibiotic biosynthesis monooxygenase [Sphingobacteriales bacterium]MBI3720753.1 antibiotic biosynthesis monooxygenase [Sphingobacteriales bacterium]
MSNVALYVRLEAKKGKEAEVENFLRNGLRIAENEPSTTSWYAVRMGPSTFGIFDTFPDNNERETHLKGELAKALKAKTNELFSKEPVIEKLDILAAKMPELAHH